MKKTLCLMLILVMVTCAAACSKGGRGTTRLYMVYMNGSDLETDYGAGGGGGGIGAATDDLNEMARRRAYPKTRGIFVQTGGH